MVPCVDHDQAVSALGAISFCFLDSDNNAKSRGLDFINICGGLAAFGTDSNVDSIDSSS